jgi:hypothetical protein
MAAAHARMLDLVWRLFLAFGFWLSADRRDFAPGKSRAFNFSSLLCSISPDPM